MDTRLMHLMHELQYAEKNLDELNHAYMQSVREEIEFAHFDKGISDYYKSAIEAAESAIAVWQKRIDNITDNEEFVNRFGEELHALYKKRNPGFDKFTKLEDVKTTWPEWNYLVPGEPCEIDLDAFREPSPFVPELAIPEPKTAYFVTYKKGSQYITIAYAPEINTVFVRI